MRNDECRTFLSFVKKFGNCHLLSVLSGGLLRLFRVAAKMESTRIFHSLRWREIL